MVGEVMLKERNEALRQKPKFEFCFALFSKTEELIGSLNARVKIFSRFFKISVNKPADFRINLPQRH